MATVTTIRLNNAVEGVTKLFCLTYIGEKYYVEATGVEDALSLWKDYVKGYWKEEYEGTEEPETIVLLYKKPVIRRE